MTEEEKKEAVIKNLIENLDEIIEMKKSAIKTCDNVSHLFAGKETAISKELSTSKEDDTDDVIKRTIIGNTYNWMDSHDDVHIKGIFSKSIKERGQKIFHLHDHVYGLRARVGKFSKVYERDVSWRDLGVDIDGKTVALMADSDIKRKYNESIFDQYKEGDIDQHSVGMYYGRILLAVNDPDDPNREVYYKNWKKYRPLVANGEKADKKGYFYAVLEAKLIEISAVLEGSNEITPTVDAKDTPHPPAGNEGETEPPVGTQKEEDPKSLGIAKFFM